MNFGFKTKATVEPVVSVESLENNVNKVIETFTTTVSKLRKKAAEALSIKTKKEEEIAVLQAQCAGLDTVSTRATSMADKIEGLLN